MRSTGDGADPRRQLEEAQWERAHQAWELVVRGESADLRSPPTCQALFRILRVKRAERSAFLGGLPGVVRRGARVDLEPIEQALRAAGLPCELRRARDAGPPRRGG